MNLIRSALFAAALFATPLAACANGPLSGGVRFETGRALDLTELAVTGANVLAKTAAETGVCRGACATSVRPKLKAANDFTGAAYTAYKSGDNSTAKANIQSAAGALSDVKRTIPEGTAP